MIEGNSPLGLDVKCMDIPKFLIEMIKNNLYELKTWSNISLVLENKLSMLFHYYT